MEIAALADNRSARRIDAKSFKACWFLGFGRDALRMPYPLTQVGRARLPSRTPHTPLKKDPTRTIACFEKPSGHDVTDDPECRSTSLIRHDFTAIKRAVTGPAEFAS
jgi:hypothetical protein